MDKCLKPFANAGARFKLTDLAFDDMEKEYNVFLADPSQESMDNLDKAEELLISQTEHQTCKEYGENKKST
eukprot:12913163-Prorocentrum_lima.AAC.1